MKFGFILPNYGDKIAPGDLGRISAACEEAGFDSVWATDHIAMPTELREPYGQVLEPLVTLAAIAAETSTIKLGTSIVVITQRNPVLAAKQVATLDSLSGGRVILGLGAGWAEKEFQNLGHDFRRRGRYFDESIRLMRALWSEEVVNFDGDFFHVKDAVFLPKPAGKGVPLWIAGSSERAIERAAELGDGWHPVGLTPEALAAGVQKLRGSERELTISLRMTTDVRKKRDEVSTSTGEKRAVVSGTREEIAAALEKYEDAGLQYYCASMLHPDVGEILKDIGTFSSEFISSFG
jgi:probable F420-dependent oxidoreductase